MNTEELIGKAPLLSLRDRYTRIALLVCLAFFAVLAILMDWRTELLLSPASRIRVVDEFAAPVPGVRVVQQWGLSVLQNGEVRELTDLDGWAVFQPVTVPMSMLRRLHIRIQPSARGLGYENYGPARFRVFLPEDFTAGGNARTEKPFPSSAPSQLPNDHGMVIREFWQPPNRGFHHAEAFDPARVRRAPRAFVDVFFPPGSDTFELPIHRSARE